jgi:hypothetical protein
MQANIFKIGFNLQDLLETISKYEVLGYFFNESSDCIPHTVLASGYINLLGSSYTVHSTL